jgi:cytosine/adenosine deaminase-related metal-dependent hydrolase
MPLSTRLLLLLLTLGIAGCAPLQRVPMGGAPADPAAAILDGGGYPTTVCDAAYAGRAAACSITGSGTRQAIRANLISGGQLYIGGTLLVAANGQVQAAGCLPAQPDAVQVDCPGALLSAGFLNLHEHIDYSYQQPASPPVLKWAHRNEWRKLPAAERGFEGDAPKDKAVATEVSERALLRHALSGATAVSGAKDYQAFLRNLKLPGGGTALGTPFGLPVLDNTFPVGDAASMVPLPAPCTAEQVAAVRFAPAQPFIPHVGEGTNDSARFEVDCVLDAVRGKTTPSAFIHGVAITPAQVQRLQVQGVAVVLSPRSNFQLYGATAPVAALRAAGIALAIGTDWSPSGSLTVLDEARCLDRYNRDHLQGQLRASDLHRMLTADGARAVGLAGQLGTLAPGEWADLVLIDTEGQRSLGEILARTALPQTLAVMVGGRVASAPLAWAGQLPQLDHCSADPRALCGVPRLVCGAQAQRPLATLLQGSTYTLDDSRLCKPQPTDDCVPR